VRTAALMADTHVPAIFEAAFEYDGIRIRVDMLERLARFMQRVAKTLQGVMTIDGKTLRRSVSADWCSKPRIDGLTLQRQDGENTFVHATQRLPGDEPLQRLETKGELPDREPTLGADAAFA